MALEVPPKPVSPETLRARGSVVSLVLVIASVVLAIAAQVVLRAAMKDVGAIGSGQLSEQLRKAVQEPRLWLGLVLFTISVVIWLAVLSRVPLSIAYAFVGLSYPIIVVLDRFLLDEQVPLLRFVGAAVVAAGVLLIGLSSGTVARWRQDRSTAQGKIPVG